MTDEQTLHDAVIEALDIEPDASKTQIVIKILRLRAEAARVTEMELEIIEAEQQRERAEARLARVLSGHVRFIGDLVSRSHALTEVAEEFHEELSERIASDDFLDAFDLATAKLREQNDSGERHDLNDVEEEFPVDPVDELEEDVDPLGLTRDEPKPEVRMDFPGPQDEKISGETTTDFVDERNRVPFTDGGVPLDGETREWMQTTAVGGARDDS